MSNIRRPFPVQKHKFNRSVLHIDFSQVCIFRAISNGGHKTKNSCYCTFSCGIKLMNVCAELV